MKDSPGLFTISLDFELHWGVRDKRSVERYGPSLLGARQIVPELLAMFERYGVRATWATVGFLFYEERDALEAALPQDRPGYHQRRYSPYTEEVWAEVGADERQDPYHFGRSLLERIQAIEGQEIGTHTFSHYYCREQGESLEAFDADLAAACRAAERMGVELESIVFPRNQVSARHLEICVRHGIRVYRGNQAGWLYEARNEQEESLARRAGRLLDAYLPLPGPRPERRPLVIGARSVPATRFLRPWTPRTRHLEPARRARIRGELVRAIARGGLYHLWWHPHNFGAHPEENLASLELVLEDVARRRDRGHLQTVTMLEAAQALEARDAR